MKFSEYEKEAANLCFVGKDKPVPLFYYLALGLSGETGEVMEELKKSMRGTDGLEITPDRKANIFWELGDVLWYLSNLAVELGFTLEEVAAANISKLKERQAKKGK